MKPNDRIYVAGHRGLVGSALVRALLRRGFSNLVLATREQLDLRNPVDVAAFFAAHRPQVVFLAAAKVGGIAANQAQPGDFIHDNLLIQTHVIEAARRIGVEQLIFFASSCVYPRLAPQPMREAHLLTGPLEPTNDAYAIAKIAGVMMVDAYRRQHGLRGTSLVPANVYGPGDNFDRETSHVVAALIRKVVEGKRSGEPVVLWGSGAPRRELLHVDDLADAALFVAERDDVPPLVNVGTGQDLSIRELATKLATIVGYDGVVTWDGSRPDGMPRKVLDVSRLGQLGWRAQIDLERGLAETVRWYTTAR